MTVSDWVTQKEIRGTSSFSRDELQSDMPNVKDNTISVSLSRLSAVKRILQTYKGFYVIVPPQYKLKLWIPPSYYIDNLMKHLGKPYYMSLLTSSAIFGAAHQKPQVDFVTTTLPANRTNHTENGISWIYTSKIPEKYLIQINSETSAVNYSSAELTALDLIKWQEKIGGLSRVATVLEELTESTDFNRLEEDIFDFIPITVFQRLGYILEEVLGLDSQAHDIYNLLTYRNKQPDYTPLSTTSKLTASSKNQRWRILVNNTIEPDEI